MTQVFVGLGSNQGDSRALLRDALVRLQARATGHLAAVSSLYRTEPLGYTCQPDFLNAVALFHGADEPGNWLDSLLAVEGELGRLREGPRWGPRPVDLDLLAVGTRSLETPHLTLPHPRIQERRFVLVPWAELAPDFLLPYGLSVSRLLRLCPDEGAVARASGPEWVAERSTSEGGGG
ncbi:2-amino-4-hydroxy-6-hydroxymethyldihydropteridine diphosphokinase [Thiohalorhabdus sp.]|uniref:2-amino-4-hydroxy-6- hydroxymethyldihydropteridine diphosphokinase n=1 Tax=Thiohalorhabdus sp. TaxID=3094134 RepID=UPI002FC298FC